MFNCRFTAAYDRHFGSPLSLNAAESISSSGTATAVTGIIFSSRPIALFNNLIARNMPI
jgi:hypothetical protein